MTHIPLQSATAVIQICCGDDFSLALSAGGNVYSTGNGSYGIHGCGTDELANRYQFAPIGSDNGGFFKQRQIKYVSVGENHCGVIDANGNAFTWGLNTSGQCGIPRNAKARSANFVSPPHPVTLSVLVEKHGINFTGHQTPMEAKRVKAIMIECGGTHSLFLS